MEYNFDEYINRIGTACSKWDGFQERFPGLDSKGCIPMWVADTDFKAPKEVIDALVEKAAFGIYGYPKPKGDSFDQAVIDWIYKRHNWKLQKQWIVATAGIVPAVTYIIQALTKVGEGVIIQPPVYYPFKSSIGKNNRVTVENPLIFSEEKCNYEIDFKDLETKVKDPNNKLLILCNPHNPVGRVWSKEELEKIGQLCLENGVLIFSDEIHSDLIFKGYTHTPIASLDEKIREITITAYSPSKTFNLAGLQTSAIVIPNKELQRKYKNQLKINCVDSINIFGTMALEAAYSHGETYLTELLQYIENNIDYAIEYFDKNLKGVKIIKPEGTYLVWIDFRGTGLSYDEIDKLVIEKAKVAVDFGRWFGKEGGGFLRFNFACPRSTIEKALNQLKAAIDKI